MRTYVVTGSASGIGLATQAHLERQGARVIGVDLQRADVVADLAVAAGRAAMTEAVAKLSDATIDGVIACAGSASLRPGQLVALNYFGAIGTLEGLRPLLERSRCPRAVVISSQSLIDEVDDEIVELCLDGNEYAAIERAERNDMPRTGPRSAYSSAKRAVARWVRRAAPTTPWAGKRIAVNAVAPGTIRTPLSQRYLDSERGRAALAAAVPMPLGGPGEPEDVASLLGWLAGEENALVTGQVVFIDGGSDAVLRGDDVW